VFLRSRARGSQAVAELSPAGIAQAHAQVDRGLEISPREPPPPPTRRAIRNRLLEDPSDPIGWVRDGIARGSRLGLCEEGLARAMLDALDRHPRVVFAHGDLLPRNLLRVGDGLAPVDWECAGSHPESWDRALLWANLPAARPRIEAGLDVNGRGRRAFWACAGFALVRELKFQRGRPSARADALRQELERVRAELGAIRG
jgi:hypothetical protein